ncbi:MAG: peptidoglycan-binding domain-containing protein [Gemmatimonadetes bacterium]|nr:peptidoglycan-binding domain-containing protein [Gemmatimonadota bacterium]
MPSVKRTVTLLLALAVCLLGVHSMAATPGVAVADLSKVAVPQDPASAEASLALDRSTRRLIQQGLRNEGFDPGTPDGLFGPRMPAAIRKLVRLDPLPRPQLFGSTTGPDARSTRTTTRATQPPRAELAVDVSIPDATSHDLVQAMLGRHPRRPTVH